MALAAVHRAEYALFRALESVAGSLSWSRRIALGTNLGRLWHALDGRRRGIARENVARAFPDWRASRVRALVKANFEHLGATGAEFLGLSVVTAEELLDRCRFEGLEYLEQALAAGRGVFLLTGHVGNWELAGAATAARGYPFYAVGRRLKNPWVNDRVTRLRRRFGGSVINHRNAVRPILRALKEGAAVALLMDQRALFKEAVPSTFFGRRVATNHGLAILALRTGAPVVPGFCERDRATYVMRFQAPVVPPDAGHREQQIRLYTERFDATIERAVRRRPEQWFWVHRRWRLPGSMR